MFNIPLIKWTFITYHSAVITLSNNNLQISFTCIIIKFSEISLPPPVIDLNQHHTLMISFREWCRG